ncbi:MAG: hypothetical protein GX159_08030 [Flavobacteriaceae bacterium]|jgi:hypothetical protein|nr:hypothetical protein [Flavobacteriaceae bacterium]
MKVKLLIILILGFGFFVSSCKNETTFQGNHDPEVIKTYKNQSTAVSRMDSLASVNFITRQKLTEVYELSSLYSSNPNDSLLREILYPQMQSYFLKNDSVEIRTILSELDSLRVHFVEIGNLRLNKKDSLRPDSVKLVDYSVRYFSQDKKLIDSLQKTAQYILKKEPKKFKHEFIFYFNDLSTPQVENDTISSGVTQ